MSTKQNIYIYIALRKHSEKLNIPVANHNGKRLMRTCKQKNAIHKKGNISSDRRNTNIQKKTCIYDQSLSVVQYPAKRV